MANPDNTDTVKINADKRIPLFIMLRINEY